MYKTRKKKAYGVNLAGGPVFSAAMSLSSLWTEDFLKKKQVSLERRALNDQYSLFSPSCCSAASVVISGARLRVGDLLALCGFPSVLTNSAAASSTRGSIFVVGVGLHGGGGFPSRLTDCAASSGPHGGCILTVDGVGFHFGLMIFVLYIYHKNIFSRC